ncbi:hypothetical protein [Flammeovirga agarivorans]|uniref:Uncharacterized protein n=1 Tax=Flammeovirga agarivorans TaxID=2726742 RepID=A0A7X8SRN4_9BACT|nr:hypothetical protein [Flammeovirga agarivorans]NLR95106.1 hypothetical protein [Flammeovirga agarivorans]
MMKQITFLLLLFCGFSTYGNDRIIIKHSKLYSENQLGINSFYFVHQTFADAFFMTDLYKQLSYDEMNDILNKVYLGLTKDDQVKVYIKQENGADARLIFSVYNDTKDGDMVVLATNFNRKTRQFDEEVDKTNSIVRWYFIRDHKLVYRKDIYSKKEERNREKENQHSLIDYYLFDDNHKNDHKVKGLIDELLLSDQSEIEKLYAHLYLGEYWLLSNELVKAESSVEALEDFFKNSKTIPKAYSLIVNMAKTEFEILKRMKNK